MGVSNRIIGLGRTHPDIIEDVIKVATHQGAASKWRRWEKLFIFLYLRPCAAMQATRRGAWLGPLFVRWKWVDFPSKQKYLQRYVTASQPFCCFEMSIAGAQQHSFWPENQRGYHNILSWHTGACEEILREAKQQVFQSLECLYFGRASTELLIGVFGQVYPRKFVTCAIYYYNLITFLIAFITNAPKATVEGQCYTFSDKFYSGKITDLAIFYV